MLVHALFEFAQQFGQLRRAQRGVVGGLFGDSARLAARRLVRRHVGARAFHDVEHRRAHAPGHDPVLDVVFDLFLAPAIGFVDRDPHRVGDAVRVQDRLAAQVARRAADGLDQRAGRAQETFLVGIQDRDQRDFRHVQTLAQQVDADQHVELAQPEIAQDLDPLDGFDVRMQIAHAHVVLAEIVGQVFGHALGQRGHQHAIAHRHALADFREQIVDLGGDRTDLHLRIDQPGRAHHQFHDLAFRVRAFVRPRRGRDVDAARRAALPLLELQRPVVERRGQPETELDQGFLARSVALVHRAELRNGDVRFVHHQQRVRRQIIVQARRRFPGHAAGEMARIIFHAVAISDLGQHLQVVGDTLLQPLRLDQLVGRVERLQSRRQLQLDRLDRLQHGAPGGDVMRFRIDGVTRYLADHLAVQRIEQRQVFDFAVEQLDPQRFHLALGRMHVDGFAAHAIGRAPQLELVARILHFGQATDQFALVDALAAHHVQHHAEVFVRIAQAVDRRHGGDDDRVAALQQRLGRRQAHLLDMLVDAGILLDEGIGRRHVGLRLVVVVVADEIFDRIVREETLELAVQLRRQGLVRRHHQHRLLHRLDDVGDGVGLARSGHPEQGLPRDPGFEAVDQATDRLRLVAGRPIGRDEFEAV